MITQDFFFAHDGATEVIFVGKVVKKLQNGIFKTEHVE